jgi:hypothetical protein
MKSDATILANQEGERVEPVHLEETFHALAAQWKVDALFMSSVTDMVNLSSYQAIIAMGERAIPLLLGELAREPNHWFAALTAITGEEPVPPEGRGNLDRMTEAWLRWGHDRGYRW